jgi:hypothetical protein
MSDPTFVNRKRLSEDDDMLELESGIPAVSPRKDADGNFFPMAWDRFHLLATREVVRMLASNHDWQTYGTFEVGRVGQDTWEQLRGCAAHLALSYLYHSVDNGIDPNSFNHRQWKYYWDRGQELFKMVAAPGIQYDRNNSKTIERNEEHVPSATLMLLG